MKMKLDFQAIESELLKMENQSLVVGVLDNDAVAKVPDFKKPLVPLKGSSGMARRTGLSRRAPRRRVKLWKIAIWLDRKRGIISDVLINKNNRDLVKIAQMLAKRDKTADDIKRLENAGRAFMRVPIFRGDYGSNAKSTQDRKGFDKYGVQTGSLMDAIRAKYYQW